MVLQTLTREQKIAQQEDLRTSAQNLGVNLASSRLGARDPRASLVAPPTRLQSGFFGTRLTREQQQRGTIQRPLNPATVPTTTPTADTRGVTARQTAEEQARQKAQAGISSQIEANRQRILTSGGRDFIATRAAATGKRGRIEFDISSDPEIAKIQRRISGLKTRSPSPLASRQLREQQNQLEALISERATEGVTPLEEIIASQRKSIQESARSLATTGATGTTDQERIASGVINALGLDPNTRIKTNSDGTLEIEGTDIELDPFSRADKRNEEERQRAFSVTNESFSSAKTAISDRFTFKTGPRAGQLTDQGKRQMTTLLRKQKDALERTEKDFKFQREGIILTEAERQAQIEKSLEAEKDPAKVLARATAQRKLDRVNEKLVSGEAENLEQALALIKREDTAFGQDPDVESAFQEFRTLSSVAGEPIDFKGVLGLEGVNGDFNKARQVYEADGVSDAIIDEMERDYNTNVRGYDPEISEAKIRSRKFERTQQFIFDGKGDNFGNDVSALLLEYGKTDPTGFVQEEFMRNVIASPNTNFREKTIAQMALNQFQTRQFKAGIQPKILKDRFGNIVAVDPRTLGVTGVGGRGGVRTGAISQQTIGQIRATADPVVASIARQINEGAVTLEDAKRTTSPQKFEAVGTELARLRQESRVEGELTPNQREAQGFLSAFNSGELTQKEILATIGVANPDVKARFNNLVAEQGGKRVFGRDSSTIADINTQIESLKALKENDLFESISGPLKIPDIFGTKGDALTLISSVLSSQTLNALASAKGRGITFGALSTSEVNLVRDSAGKLAARANKNAEGIITGFKGSEKAFLSDLEFLIKNLEKSVERKTGIDRIDIIKQERPEQYQQAIDSGFTDEQILDFFNQ